MSERKEVLVLNPKEVATEGRTEINLHFDATQVRESGPDWGQFEPDMFMVEGAYGSIPIDDRLPNRVISIPLVLGATGDFDAARIALQAEVARIREEGGWFKRECIGGAYGEAGERLYADIVKASLKLGGGTKPASQGIDPDAELILEVLPDWYGDEEVGELHEGAGDLSWVEQIKGELPGRVTSLTVTDKSGNNQMGLGYHFRRKNYSSDAGAAWAFEAEDLVPLDLATIATLSEASPAGSAANNSILHNNLSTSWTPVLSLSRLPKVRSVAAASASTGKVTPALPTGVKEYDILIMVIETENQAVTVPSGWAHVSGSPVEVASGTTTRLTVLWKRASAAETAPTLEDPGDHIIARVMAVSGCVKTGNPWDVKATATELASDTSVAIPGASTSVDNCLIVAAVATGTDVSSAAHIASFSNSNFQTCTEQMDSWTAEGGGGGFGVATGVKLKAGAYGETTATIGTANFKAMMSFALRPETGGSLPSHVGLYNVWARVYTKSSTPPWVRLVYDVGDLVAPSTNTQVQVPGSNNFYLINLGQVNIRSSLFGTHRWQAAVQAYGISGEENIYIDRLYFECADESSGILSGAPDTFGPALTEYIARDEFNQKAGAATGQAAAVGGTYAAATNSDATDFEVDATSHALKRTAVSDTGTIIGGGALAGRAIGTPVEATDLAFGMDFLIESNNPSAMPPGQIVSWVDATHFMAVTLSITGQGWTVALFKGGSGLTAVGSTLIPGLSVADKVVRGRLLTVVQGTRMTVYAAGPSGDLRRIHSITNTMAGVKGKAFIYDGNSSATAGTRYFDNLRMWVPEDDAVLFANCSAQLSSGGFMRQSADGTAYGPIAYPASDLPRIPVSGPEGRPVEISVKPTRGNFKEIPDSGLDKIAAQLSYRPCWTGVPGSS